jgi:hypothetical protein
MKLPKMGMEDADDGSEEPKYVLPPELCASLRADDPAIANIIITHAQKQVGFAAELNEAIANDPHESYRRLSEVERAALSLICMGMAHESPALLLRMVDCLPEPTTAEEFQLIERLKILFDEKRTAMEDLGPLVRELLNKSSKEGAE